MRRSSLRLPLLVLGAFLIPLVVSPTPARADHNPDQHSDNMSLLFEAPNSTGATNSDLAFWGDRAYAGNYDGFRIFDISTPASPQQLADFSCPGAQVDTVVWNNELLFTAVDRTMTGPQCGALPTEAHDDPTGWEGVRIFDVSDPTAPAELTSVYTDCGAHTITLFPKSRRELLLYVSSYPLRPGPTCGPDRGPENGNSPLHEKISVISVPVATPEEASVVVQPKISYPGDPDNRFDPAEHGLVGFDPLTACHDIGVHVRTRLAAAACAEQLQVWRIDSEGIPDTEHPLWVFDDNTDEDGPGGGDVAVDFWHTARLTWDGKFVQADDESFGDGCPPVTEGIGDTGRTHFLDVATGTRQSTFTLPRSDAEAYCSVHQGNFVKTRNPHAYTSVSAWYSGGVNVIDFSDPANPKEIAFYDAGPTGPGSSNNWASYWYEGPSVGDEAPSLASGGDTLTIYGNDIGRGFQTFEADIDEIDRRLDHMNPQTVD